VDRYAPAALNRTIAEESNPLKLAGLAAIRAYQLGGAGTLSACQFAPSCSRYTFGAIAAFGLLQGSILGAERISRCHGFAALGDYPGEASSGRFADPVDGSRPLVPSLSRLGL
jgi:putative component of membrane protein insertase Oxa1/YidC/SpoIIIJ protein YidD